MPDPATPVTPKHASSRRGTRDLLRDPIASTLARMTGPVIGGIVTMMLFNLVDAWFIAQLGTAELAAVTMTFPVTFGVISIAIGLSIGTTAVVGRRLGRGELETVKARTTDSSLLGLLLGLVMLVSGLASIEPLFGLLGADDTLMPHIRDYMQVWYFGAPFVLLPRVLGSVLRAEGNTLVPSLVMAAAGVLNALLDPLLIFGIGGWQGMGVAGAALATVLSWLAMTLGLLALPLLRARLDFRHLSVMRLVTSWREIGAIGLPAALTSVMTPIATALVTRIVSQHGHAAVAAYGIGSRIESLALILVLALSMTLSPFISQNDGAGQQKRVWRAIHGVLAFILVWQLVVWLGLGLGGEWIAARFAESQEVAGLVSTYLWLIPAALGAQGVIILANSSLNALHKPRRAMMLSLVRLFALLVPLAWLGGALYGVIGIFAGVATSYLLMGGISYLALRSVLRQRA
ncbi:MATE family efflux transporter [Cobetia sp. LC6]|uniref:MATE family efflux transporter n=1 Tax=Cobetia TaxID=204286 RepID=UPI002552AEBD|nr:MATE family efflux transporter [Cobetia sp. LC6]MDL2192097.1 MATE family efflux transporter [Cobetia sp. LC6]